MARFLKDSKRIIGKSPEDLVFVGDRRVEKTSIKIVQYSLDSLVEAEVESLQQCSGFLEAASAVTWVSVYGLHEPSVIKKIGEIYSVHPLILQDILHTGQRPRLEEYENSVFYVLKLLKFNKEAETVFSSQFSFIVGENYIITFNEEPVDIFSPLRDRLRKPKSRLRRNGPDYLAYTLIDAIIDNYMVVIENIGSRIEDIEDAVIENPDSEILNQITRYKREVNYLRKTVRPVRELILKACRLDSEHINEQILPFWKDLHGISIQATEVLEHYREMLSDHLNIYNTSVSIKLNEIMKVLTIFAAIFIPLTFIAGIYGTNFEFMPELHYKYSYFIFWIVLISIALIMLRYFKRKGWI